MSVTFLIYRIARFGADFFTLTLAVTAKIVELNFKFSPPELDDNSRPVAVLGNGPSLKNDLVEIYSHQSEWDFCAVNFFANTHHFRELKPSIYVLADPLFWRADVNADYSRQNILLRENLLAVDWSMELVCAEGGVSVFQELFKCNDHVTVVGLKSSWFEIRSKSINIAALRFRIMTPNFVNVLVAAIWYVLTLGRKRVFIFGADFSGFKDLEVEQNTNALNSSYKHFYAKTSSQGAVCEKYIGGVPKDMSVRLYQVWLSFSQMYNISKVAKYWQIEIENRSSYSLLDCFERSLPED